MHSTARKLCRAGGLAALMVATASAVQAGQKLEGGGSNVMSETIDVLQLDQGHVLVLYSGDGTIIMDDPARPEHLGQVVCKGTIDILAAGQSSAAGYCAHKDKDGDQWFSSFHREMGKTSGSWQMISGTGKWHGVTGSGSYQHTPVAEGKGVARWTGTSELQ